MGSGAQFGSMGNVLRQNMAPLLSRQVHMHVLLVLLRLTTQSQTAQYRGTGSFLMMQHAPHSFGMCLCANAHLCIGLQSAAQHERSACGPRYRCGALMGPAGVDCVLGCAGGGQGAGQPHHRVHADGAHRQPGVQVQVRPAGCMTRSTPATQQQLCFHPFDGRSIPVRRAC